jgi:hypothetical protein
MTNRYTREPDRDKRLNRGDDFAGDAWRDNETGKIKYVAVNRDPNDAPQRLPAADRGYGTPAMRRGGY